MNHHATVTIEEVENGMLVHIVDDEIRSSKALTPNPMGQIPMSDVMNAIKPKLHIANTIEEACTRVTEYFNHREKV